VAAEVWGDKDTAGVEDDERDADGDGALTESLVEAGVSRNGQPVTSSYKHLHSTEAPKVQVNILQRSCDY
jgi:hypothetical protein